MHGVARDHGEKTKEQKDIIKLKISKFCGLKDLLLKNNSIKNFDKNALNLTEKMLSRHCDFSTIWNYRRKIICHIVDSKTVSKVLVDDMIIFYKNFIT